MRTALFTGFPGSGKTTLLLSLVSHLKDRTDPGAARVILTENGDPGTDERLMAESPFGIADLTRGCVGCASLAGSVFYLIEESRREDPPPVLLVEASCLAGKTLRTMFRDSFPGEDPPLSVLVVDPDSWDERFRESPGIATDMAKEADFVLLNFRVRPGSAAAASDRFPAEPGIASELRKLNPRATIARADVLGNPEGIWTLLGPSLAPPGLFRNAV
ncbi:MAG: hypothetical protein LBF41_01580 [Deltaproteobacteria bacterium]|nr:hypothetical protein [Deltaproteobacteria bacterium]